LTVQEAERRGVSDEDQLQFASENNRIVVTYNARDFVPIAREWARLGRHHSGLITGAPKSMGAAAAAIAGMMELYPTEEDWRDLTMYLPSR